MGWLRRDRGRDALPKGFAERLRSVVTSLPGGQGQEQQVIAYVMTGEPVRVLQQLTVGQGSPFGYHLASAGQAHLYAYFDEVDPELWVRWGRVLEATLGTNQWSTPLALAGAIPAWLERILVSLGAAYGPRGYGNFGAPPEPVPLAFAALAAVAEVGGVETGQLLESLFVASSGMGFTQSFHGRRVVAGTTSFPEALVHHLDRVSIRLTSGAVEQRTLFCTLVSSFPDADLAALGPHLAVAATATATKVRDVAQPLLLRVLPAGAPTLRELAVEGKPDVRSLALELLWHHGTDADRDFARETAASDRTPRIRALVDSWDGTAEEVSTQVPAELDVPAQAPIDWRVELTPQLREQVQRTATWHNAQIVELNRSNARFAADYQTRWGRPHPAGSQPIPLDPDLGTRLLDSLGSARPPTVRGTPNHWQLGATAGHFAALVEATPVAAVKVLASLGFLVAQNQLTMFAVNGLEVCHARTGGPDLLTLQQMLDETGLPGCELIWKAITASWQTLARDWADEQVWPFLARNLDFVVAHSRPGDGDWSTDASAFYRLVGTLPAQPPRLVEHLFSIALGLGKTHRAEAQAALRSHPTRARRAADALTDGKAEVRTVAATWLAQMADAESLAALETAVAKEKHDVAKGALLDALEALGRPVEDYLDRDRLAADADKAVAKGLPKDLDWLVWDRLPDLHWADSGARVPLPVVQHLVGQAVRGKSPEPNAILRKYVGMLVEADGQALAHALLESWLAEDIRPIDAAEALRRAQAQAASMHHYMQSYPQAAAYAQSPLKGKNAAEIAAALLPSIARTPAGSAAASKGVLAVVAAAGGRDVVPPTERYLKDWYGQRASQGKALIGMLAWVRHPSATQLLLSIGSRFRTKSFQVEATRQVEALAEREGWTVAELADRTVPTAGFDGEGRLELSYGDRAFTGRLLPDLTIELRTEDGAVIKGLPAPRQSDDAERAKAAKAAFSAAKKELKSLAALQQQRLYEAMCTERSWSPQDWQRYLAGHPVLRLLCQRLVWVAQPTDEPQLAFRLLDDGTLSDVHDEEVTLPGDGVVRLAHDTNLDPEQVQAWLEHLADYEVQPLFQQLGKGLLALPDDLRRRHAIEDLRGHTLEAFALRNRALKLGWTRGPAEDGGWFLAYLKRFPTLGLVAELGFTGNGLPEENRIVALLELTFVREDPRDSTRPGQPVSLGDLPAVLLSETWQDVRSIAAEGGGFDPDWERNTQL